ncbi:hypothetical protein KIK84_02735 [Curvibacter sp. CHRR-16]|uniref:hypothetical protein n=1 Tax=Curvibacter sp. CHRR-16 TaxID=2835872 RepID=UPI001BDA0059|nr:hypothetical protein [Curvibacter sp. CHRR-16]MBT0569231.1 hypothetical protein [Curvibacter sp. CHRR-16]
MATLAACSGVDKLVELVKPPPPPKAYVFVPSSSEPTARLRVIGNTWVYGGVSPESCPRYMPVLVSPRRMLNGQDVTKPAWAFPTQTKTFPDMLPRQGLPLPSVDEAVANNEGVYGERVAELLVPAGRPFVIRTNPQASDVVAVFADVCPAQIHRYVFEAGGQYEARIGMDGQRCDFQVYDLNRGPEAAQWTRISAVQSPVRGCK